MTDPRLVEPERSSGACADDGCAEHRYWCWKRITGAVLLGTLLLGVAGVTWRRLR